MVKKFPFHNSKQTHDTVLLMCCRCKALWGHRLNIVIEELTTVYVHQYFKNQCKSNTTTYCLWTFQTQIRTLCYTDQVTWAVLSDDLLPSGNEPVERHSKNWQGWRTASVPIISPVLTEHSSDSSWLTSGFWSTMLSLNQCHLVKQPGIDVMIPDSALITTDTEMKRKSCHHWVDPKEKDHAFAPL